MTTHTPSTQVTKRKPKSTTTHQDVEHVAAPIKGSSVTPNSGVRIFIFNEANAVSNAQMLSRLQGIHKLKLPKGNEAQSHLDAIKQEFFTARNNLPEIINSRKLHSFLAAGVPLLTNIETDISNLLAEVEELSRSKQTIHSVTFSPFEGTRVYVQDLVDKTPIRRVDPVAERLQKKGVDAVLNGTAWLPATEVGTRADPKAVNKYALASRLLKEGRVFAIERGGRKEFPSYAFDPLGNPVPAMKEVLGILAGYSPFRLASWFESTSSQLGGRRPREILATDPDAVIAAARAQKMGPVHG